MPFCHCLQSEFDEEPVRDRDTPYEPNTPEDQVGISQDSVGKGKFLALGAIGYQLFANGFQDIHPLTLTLPLILTLNLILSLPLILTLFLIPTLLLTLILTLFLIPTLLLTLILTWTTLTLPIF